MASSNLSNDNTIVIPDDIINQHIIPKMPPQSLNRFKCVNKLWNSIISDPNFKISPEHESQALVISSEIYKRLSSNNISIPLRLEEPHAPLPQQDIAIIFGSCNGLVLFSNDISNIFLWNPCTSYCQKVLELDELGYDYSVVPGFCYDPSSDDYVVLASFRQFSPGWNLPVISATLKSKSWRRVRFPYDVDSIIPNNCIVNNILHWLASPSGVWEIFDNADIIIYFDAPSNGFNELPSPDRAEEGGRGHLVGLSVLEDRLCLMRLNRCDIDLLVMKEYGVKESWTTMFCIPNEYSLWRTELLLYNWKMDILVIKLGWSELYAYYPNCGTKNKIEIPGWVIPYEESLISPTEYYWNDEYDKKLASSTAAQALRRF